MAWSGPCPTADSLMKPAERATFAIASSSTSPAKPAAEPEGAAAGGVA
ncbi:hypothetical protein ACVWZ3_001887 [Bradyrhizobium sp. i1.3.6]